MISSAVGSSCSSVSLADLAKLADSMTSSARLTAASAAGELRLALLQEGHDSLAEVLRLSALLLEDGLELQHRVKVLVEAGVDRALDRGVGPGRTGGQLGAQRADRAL